MTGIAYDCIAVGDAIPALTKPPIDRTTLALYCGASGDHNPIHVDIDFAKAAGMPDVFAHGMLIMAYLGQVITNWASQASLRHYGVRFASITWLGSEITCTGKVTDKFEEHGVNLVRVELQATDQSGDVKLIGDAVLAID